jgi:hydrogenase maturation factor
VTAIWDDLTNTLKQYDVNAIGSHVEVTPVVNQPVIVGQMIGKCIGNALLDPRNSNAGDQILLWQPIALEGTAIIANQYADKLTSRYSKIQRYALEVYVSGQWLKNYYRKTRLLHYIIPLNAELPPHYIN